MKLQLFFVFVLWLHEDINLQVLVPVCVLRGLLEIPVCSSDNGCSLSSSGALQPTRTNPPEQTPLADPPVQGPRVQRREDTADGPARPGDGSQAGGSSRMEMAGLLL